MRDFRFSTHQQYSETIVARIVKALAEITGKQKTFALNSSQLCFL